MKESMTQKWKALDLGTVVFKGNGEHIQTYLNGNHRHVLYIDSIAIDVFDGFLDIELRRYSNPYGSVRCDPYDIDEIKSYFDEHNSTVEVEYCG